MSNDGRGFSKELQDAIPFPLFGEVFPNKAAPPPTPVDIRTAMLRVFRLYLSELVFVMPTGRNLDGTYKTEEFRIPKENIHISTPDAEQEVQFPSIVILGSKGNYETLGLNGYWDESTYNKFAPGTLLQWMYEYNEVVTLEIWANKRAQLWSLMSGIETGLTPTEQRYGIYLRCKDYYDQVARFSPNDREIVENPGDAVLNRRIGRITVEMDMIAVQLVNAKLMEPTVEVSVDDVPPDCSGGSSDSG